MTPSQASTILRVGVRVEVRDTVALVAIAFVATVSITAVVSSFTAITTSGWDLATQLVRWYGAGLGVYTTAVYLPMYIAHGYTRRAFLTQFPAFVVVLAAVFSLLVTLGYALERLVYQVVGWTQGLDAPSLYASATDYPMIAVELVLVVALYLAGGAAVGAAFYRNAVLGFVVLVPALLVVGVVEAALGAVQATPLGGIIESIGLGADSPELGVVLPACLGATVLLLAVTWFVARDLPIRSSS